MIDPSLFSLFGLLSAALLIVSVILAVIKKSSSYKRGAVLKPIYILVAGVFCASILIFVPLYLEYFDYATNKTSESIILTAVLSIHNSIRLFMVDGDFEIVLNATHQLENTSVAFLYNCLSSVLFVAAPLMTATFLLSFFESVTSRIKYFLAFNKDIYIFSELNEKSLVLAKSLKENNRRRAIIFTDVFKNNNEKSYELIEQAKEIGAITFKNDITVVNFRLLHRKSTKMYFFIIGENESENITQAITLASRPARQIAKEKRQELKQAKRLGSGNGSHTRKLTSTHTVGGYDYYRSGETRIYICATTASFEHQLNSIHTQYVTVRRVNEIQSLVYHTLFYNGSVIFDSAKNTGVKVFNPATSEYDEEKLISAVVIGLGRHGSEMIKALVWFAQMYPYKLEIHAFDSDADAESNFVATCPELMDQKHNDNFTLEGEAHYSITIHSGCDVSSSEFGNILSELKDTTYVLVALGNDDMNIQTAVKARVLLQRADCRPVIQSIVYDPDKTLLMSLGQKKSDLEYDITPIGDLTEHYSEECILASEIEQLALARHLSYYNCKTKEEEEQAAESFWRSDYNYRSSTASVIHSKYKRICRIPGVEKNRNPKIDDIVNIANNKEDDNADQRAKEAFRELLLSDEENANTPEGTRTPRETDMLRRLEHSRWNAYVRSEGYVCTKNGQKRDKLAKTHHCLVPFDDLTYIDQAKDDD